MSNTGIESPHAQLRVGGRIRAARRGKGLSQQDLAKLASVSQPTVANWENGSHAPRHGALGRIATILESSPAWLLGDVANTSIPAIANAVTHAHHHVPLLAWPKNAQDLDTGQVSQYISVTVSAQRPIALVCEGQTLFSDGATIICDRGNVKVMKSRYYLIEQDSVISLERFDGANFSPTTQILARAVLALREL